MSSRRSRSRSSHREIKKKHKRRQPQERSPESTRNHRKSKSSSRSNNKSSSRSNNKSSSRSNNKSSSRSNSPYEKYKKKSHKKSCSRGRSRSYSPVASHRSCSPANSRRSYTSATSRRSSRDKLDPDVCHCLGVFGLSSNTSERDLRAVFLPYGEIDDVHVIYDRYNGNSKGYAFVYFRSVNDAVEARRNTQGLVLDQRPIRVDYSRTVRPHSPTPGRYLGRRRDMDRYNSEYNNHHSSRYDHRRSIYHDWH